MVSVLDPAVLLVLAGLLVVFAVAFRYRWGALPRARALLVVSAGLFWLAHSLTQLPSFLSPPHDDVSTALAALFLLAGTSLLVRLWRRRGRSDDSRA